MDAHIFNFKPFQQKGIDIQRMKIEKTVDRTSKEKLYVQIYSIFLDKIMGGEWPAGFQLPSEEELCRIYDVSKVTVREALQELVREGCLKRQQGKGTFVTGSSSHAGIVMRTRLSEDDLHEEGLKVAKDVLKKGVTEAPEGIKKMLIAKEEIYYIQRRRTTDGEAFHEEFFIPLSIFPEPVIDEIGSKSFYDLIEEKGTRKIFRVVQDIEVTAVSQDVARIIGAKEGSSALRISRVFLGSDGIPIALSRVVGIGSKIKFRMEFERIV